MMNPSPRGSDTLNPASRNKSFIDLPCVLSLVGIGAVFLRVDELAASRSPCDFRAIVLFRCFDGLDGSHGPRHGRRRASQSAGGYDNRDYDQSVSRGLGKPDKPSGCKANRLRTGSYQVVLAKPYKPAVARIAAVLSSTEILRAWVCAGCSILNTFTVQFCSDSIRK
jgi:hypothetical protein